MFLAFLFITSCNFKKENVDLEIKKIIDTYNQSRESKLRDTYPDSALRIVLKLVEIEDQINNDSLLLDAITFSGVLYGQMGKHDSAILLYDKALHLAKKVEDSSYIAYSLYLQGLNYIDISSYKDAQQKFKDALSIYNKLKNKNRLAIVYSGLGEYYYNQEQPDSALISFQKALRFYQAKNNIRNIAITLNHISNIYADEKLYGLAFSNLKQAIKINDSISNILELGMNYNNLGLLYKDTGLYDSAIIYIKKSIELTKQTNNLIGSIISIFNLGNTYFKQGKYNEAKSYLLKVYNLSVANNIKQVVAKSLIAMAENEESVNLFDEAFNYYSEALVFSKQEGYIELQKSILFSLSGLIIKKNTNTNYLAQYKIIQDSITELNLQSKIFDLDKKYKIEKKDTEILLLKKNSELSKSRIIVLLLVIILLIGIALFILLYYRKKQLILRQQHLLLQEKDKTRDLVFTQTDLVAREQITKAENALLEIKLKEQEIVFHTISYAKLIYIFHEVIGNLDAFTYKLRGKHDREDFKKVLRYMDKSNKINPLDQFEKVFKKVYPGYHSALINKYPTLTPREIQLCALLKLNMQTKDIALITNISARSVETSRYRIRKKMDLTTNQNLILELLSI